MAELEFRPSDLDGVGGLVTAGPQRSAIAPAADVTAPADEPVSTRISHAFTTRIATIGARSAATGALTAAAGDLTRASARRTPTKKPSTRLGGAEGGSAPPPAAPQTPSTTAPRLSLLAHGTAPRTGKEIAQLFHGGAGPSSLYAAVQRLGSHADDLSHTAADLRSAARRSGYQ